MFNGDAYGRPHNGPRDNGIDAVHDLPPGVDLLWETDLNNLSPSSSDSDDATLCPSSDSDVTLMSDVDFPSNLSLPFPSVSPDTFPSVSFQSVSFQDGHYDAAYDLTGAPMLPGRFESPHTESTISFSDCGSPPGTDTRSDSIDMDQHHPIADFPMSFFPELDLLPQPPQYGFSSAFNAFDVDTHFQHISLNQTTTAAPNPTHTAAPTHTWQPNIIIDTNASLADIYGHNHTPEWTTTTETAGLSLDLGQYDIVLYGEPTHQQEDGTPLPAENTNPENDNPQVITNLTNGEDEDMAGDAVSPTSTDSSVEEALPCLWNCGKVFFKKYMRNKHHKVHDPPHACLYCSRKFAVTRDLYVSTFLSSVAQRPQPAHVPASSLLHFHHAQSSEVLTVDLFAETGTLETGIARRPASPVRHSTALCRAASATARGLPLRGKTTCSGTCASSTRGTTWRWLRRWQRRMMTTLRLLLVKSRRWMTRRICEGMSGGDVGRGCDGMRDDWEMRGGIGAVEG
jgi:hypothetical protein